MSHLDELRRYQSFISEISEGVWRFEHPAGCPTDWAPERIVDAIFDGALLVECNPSMARMCGFERPEELIGRPVRSLMTGSEPCTRQFLTQFVESGFRLQASESVEKDRAGATRYYLNNMVGVIEGGVLRGAWGTVQDITRFRELEARLKALADEAARANAAKSAFIANVSHEIRNPLGVIIGFADLILESQALPEDTRGAAFAIKRNGQQLSCILGEVLDLSKIEARRMEFEKVRVPLVPFVEEVVTSMRLSAREKGLALSWRLEGDVPAVARTDGTRLRQILTNIIGNAVKFTERGGVELRLRAPHPLVPGAPVRLELAVHDTGIGMSEPLRDSLFEPFNQLGAERSRKYGGTGLGLTLSRKLALGLGGDLYLRASVEGRGSVFVCEIDAGPFEGELAPAVTEDARAELGATDEAVADGRGLEGKRVLVVEDSEDNRFLISRYLTLAGVSVDLASNGLEGLEKASAARYDLIILDIQMPELDGHQTVRRLRASGCRLPIVALTAHAFKDERERALANGFNEYLTKPINRGLLLKTLGQRLGPRAPLV